MQRSSQAQQVLVVEDEAAAREVLCQFLTAKGYQAVAAADGEAAINLLATVGSQLALAVVDVMLPGKNGYDVLQYIRQQSTMPSLPVIFLTAKDQEREEIEGLARGADDYIAKPAGLQLILARIQAQLRKQPTMQGPVYQLGPVRFEPGKLLLTSAKGVQLLTHTEAALLSLLAAHPKQVFSREAILQHLPGEVGREVFDRTVDAHIKNIRAKLGPAASIVHTFRGIGYALLQAD